jgi:hypothetical protein
LTTPDPTAPGAPEREERYGALRTIAEIIRILAYVVAVGGTIVVIIGCIGSFQQSVVGGLVALIGGLLCVAVAALVLFAYAEIIRLVIAVEHNTWRTAEAQVGQARPLP